MTYPTFTNGQVLPASDLNAIGLWLVKSQTVGTGVSSVAVTNAFNSNFDAYKLILTGGVASTNVTLTLALGASTSGYSMSLPYVTYGSGSPAGTSVSGGTSWALAGYGTVNFCTMDLDILDPNLARYTRAQGNYVGELEAGAWAGLHKVTTAYTGFTIGVSGGTMTGGTINVYGYRKG